MAKGIFAGGIKFGVSMDTRRLKKDTKDGRTMIDRFAKLSAGALKGMAVATAAAGAAFTVMVKQQMQAVDALAKTADKLGMTTQALTGLRHAANQTGVASGTLDMAVQRMVRRTSEAAQGTGEAVKALQELGISAKEIAALEPDRQFSTIADALAKVQNQSDKIRLAFKLFDSEGVALVNTLKLGSKGLEEMQQDAEKLGLTVSRIQAKRIEAANDAIDRMMKSLTGLARLVASKLAPAIEWVSKSLTNIVVGTSGAMTHRQAGRRRTGTHFRGSMRQMMIENNVRNSQNIARQDAETAVSKKSQERVGAGLAKGMFDMLRKGKQESLAAVGRAQLAAMMLQRQGAIANTKMIGARKAGVQREQARGSLQFTRSGTAASYQQRAATKRQNEQINLDKKRNATLRAIEQGITKMDMAPAILGG